MTSGAIEDLPPPYRQDAERHLQELDQLYPGHGLAAAVEHLQRAASLRDEDPAKALEHCLTALDEDPFAERLRGRAQYNWPLHMRAVLLGKLGRKREALEAWTVYESIDGSTETAADAVLDLVGDRSDLATRLRFVLGRCATKPLYAQLELRRWTTWAEGRMDRLRQELGVDDAAAPLPRNQLGELHQRQVLQVVMRFAGGAASPGQRRAVLDGLGVHRQVSSLRSALTDEDRKWLENNWRRLRTEWPANEKHRRETVVAACLVVATCDQPAASAAGRWLSDRVLGSLLRNECIHKQDEVVDWLACAGALVGVDTKQVETAWQDGVLDVNEEKSLGEVITSVIAKIIARTGEDLGAGSGKKL